MYLGGKSINRLLLFLVIFISVSSIIFADNQLMAFQGRVGQNGASLVNGDVKVYIYDSSSGGSLVWNDTYSSAISNGYFDVSLGSVNPLSLVFGQHYWIDMDVNGENINWTGGADRIEFESSVGSITSSVQNQSGWIKTGSNVTLFDINNKVGIGTASPTSNLQIGNLTSVSTPTPITLSLGGTYSNTPGYNTKLKVYEDQASGVYGLGVSSGLLNFNVPDTSGFAWYENGEEKMRLTGSGDVGIGTISPSAKLDVNGSVRFSGNASINNMFIGDVGYGSIWAGLSNNNSATTTGYALLQDADARYTVLNKENTGDGYIGFRVANQDKMVILNNGDIGIGTISPTSKLDVNGSVNVTGNITAQNFIGNLNASYVQNAPWITGYTDTDTNNYTVAISFNNTAGVYQLNLERNGMINLTSTFDVSAFNDSASIDSLNSTKANVTDLNNEITARGNADTAISGRVDSLNATKANVTDLNSEITNRANADTNLQTNISALMSANTSANGRIDSLNNTKLSVSDQRYNETALINAVNTTSNIQNLGFYNSTYSDSRYIQGVSYQSSAAGWTNNSQNTTTTLNVGIGTTSPTQTLDVNGSVNISTDLFVAGINITDAINGGVAALSAETTNRQNNDTSLQNQISVVNTTSNIQNLGFYNSTYSDSRYVQGVAYQSSAAGWTNNSQNTTTMMNVGIGTMGPTSRLHINGTDATIYNPGAYNQTTNFLTIQNDNAAWDTTVGLLFKSDVSSRTAHIGLVGEGGVSSLVFGTSLDGAQTEKMRITGAGRVGIGSINPDSLLHINGTDATDYDSNAYNQSTNFLIIQNNALGTDDNVGILFRSGDVFRTAHIGVVANGPSASLVFGTSSTGSQTEKMRITETGNVGINTINPSNKLTVVGDINATANISTPKICLNGDCQTSWPASADGNNYTDSISFNNTAGVYQLNLQKIGMANITSTFDISAFNDSAKMEAVNTTSNIQGLGFYNSTYSDSRFLQSVPYQTSAAGWTNDSQNTSTTLNVGIGTNSPSEKFHVNGSLRVDNSTGDPIFLINTTRNFIDLWNLHINMTSYSVGINTLTTQSQFSVNGPGDPTATIYAENKIAGIAVYGNTTYSTGGIGVYGEAAGDVITDAIGVYGKASGYMATGVLGEINNEYGEEAAIMGRGGVYGIYVNANDSYYDIYAANPLNKNYLAGNLSIGTLSSTQRLEVNGSINVSSATGKVYTPELCLNGDCQTSWPTTGIWSNSSNNATYTAGRVGIGTTLPTQNLHVNGSANITGTLYASNISSSSNVSIGSGAVSMVIDNAGNVGIGTESPSQKLHINDTMRIEPRAAAPTCNQNGAIYVDTSGALCYCDGASWNVAAGGGTCA